MKVLFKFSVGQIFSFFMALESPLFGEKKKIPTALEGTMVTS